MCVCVCVHACVCVYIGCVNMLIQTGYKFCRTKALSHAGDIIPALVNRTELGQIFLGYHNYARRVYSEK